jgi:two-component system, cell cycle sensor histidine kinase and response regulator CckA
VSLRLRVRHAIPLSLGLFAVVMCVLGANMARTTSYRKLEEMMGAQASSIAQLTAAILAESDSRQTARVVESLSQLHAAGRVTVVAANQDLPHGLAPQADSLVRKAREKGAVQIEVTADKGAILVAAPFATAGSQATSAGRSVLLTETDLTSRKRQELPGIIIRTVTMTALSFVVALAVWLYLRSSFTRRLHRLIEALLTYSADTKHWRAPVDGQGDLGEIARVVNRIFADLAAERTALQENADKFSRIFTYTPMLFSVSELETGLFTEVNEEALRVSGFRRDEIIGKTSLEIGWIRPKDRMRLLSVLKERGRVDGVEVQLQTKSGSVVDCVYYGEVVTIGGKPQLVSIARDIGEERKAERALTESEERFRRLFDGAADAVIVHDRNGQIVDANQVACRALGYSREELLQLTTRDISSLRAKDVAALWERIFAEQGATIEDTHRRRDGSTFPVEVRVAPLAIGKQPLFVAAARDVTERKRMEDALLQSQKMEAVGQLAGGVAHDFNNTLTTTTMTLELLLENENLDDDTRAGLKALEAQTKRASALTRQLLMFSRRTAIEVRVFDLNDLAANLLKMLGRLLGDHIQLVFERRAVSPLVEADASMLEQSMMNLCVNARDAMPRGGRITIDIDVVRGDTVTPTGRIDTISAEYVRLSVTDTGSGMDEATQKRIFEPFFTTKEPGKGTGLGLATVHGIIAQHKGWIDVQSTLGQGSTFRVFLPRVHAERAIRENVVPVPKGNGETILVVEDEPAILNATARSLRRNGYEVIEATNGPAALEAINERNGTVDLLLSDMMMPGGLSGAELAERALRLWPKIRVIICSGYLPETNNEPDAEPIMRLQKPYAARELARAVRRCLDGHEPS